jgi:hypothetical protein
MTLFMSWARTTIGNVEGWLRWTDDHVDHILLVGIGLLALTVALLFST